LKKKSNGRGGKRPGAGRPKGAPNKATVEQRELERQFKEQIAAELLPLAQAMIRKAKGVEHLQAQDPKTGQWVSVTDPQMMAKVLNGPEQYRRLSAKDPDTPALKECWDRLFGQAKQHVEVEDVTSVTQMSDEELKALILEIAAGL
jgi:hypothetical protein